MTLLEILKGAKTLLSKGETYGSDRADFFGRPVCICYAIRDYMIGAAGGEATIYGASRQSTLAAQDFIMRKLQNLVPKSQYFDERHAKIVLCFDYRAETYGLAQEQQARHAWLDSLIKELENGNN